MFMYGQGANKEAICNSEEGVGAGLNMEKVHLNTIDTTAPQTTEIFLIILFCSQPKTEN